MATIPSTNASGRIITLDVIRGIAVMGIFAVNVIGMSMIDAAYLNPTAPKGWDLTDVSIWLVNYVLIDGKMRSLFSMLFGASMLLVIERAEGAGERGWSVHFRRMGVLALFGLFHFYVIWFGDILFVYAITGMASMLIERKAGEFNPSEFHNRYVDALKELIAEKQKSKGEKVIQDPDSDKGPPKGSNVIDLMAALKKSLGDDKRKKDGLDEPKAKKGAAKKAPAKRTAAKKEEPARKRA